MHLKENKTLGYFLLLLASVIIFLIAIGIEHWLINFDLSSLYVSFCAGFILFTPLVSLTLHPLLTTTEKIKKRSLLKNAGLVMVVQGLFFLIWMTDAIAIFSIYVDSNSFLAKAFNIDSSKTGNFDHEYYWINLALAWLFSLLSLVVGLLPCLIGRLKNLGVVGNFIAAFAYAKSHKISLVNHSFLLACSVMIPLMYFKPLFILCFPIALAWMFIGISKHVIALANRNI